MYDDVIKWKHFTLLALYVGNSPATGEFPHKDQWRGALMLRSSWLHFNYRFSSYFGMVTSYSLFSLQHAIHRLSQLLCVHVPRATMGSHSHSHSHSGSREPIDNYYECIHLKQACDSNGRSSSTVLARPRVLGPPVTWVTVAAVLDRFFFLTYLLILVISTTLIFPRWSYGLADEKSMCIVIRTL